MKKTGRERVCVWGCLNIDRCRCFRRCLGFCLVMCMPLNKLLLNLDSDCIWKSFVSWDICVVYQRHHTIKVVAGYQKGQGKNSKDPFWLKPSFYSTLKSGKIENIMAGVKLFPSKNHNLMVHHHRAIKEVKLRLRKRTKT